MARITATSMPARQQTFADTPSTQKPPKRKRSDQLLVESRFKFSSAASQSKKLKLNLTNVVSTHPSFALESEHKEGHDCHFSSALQDASLDNLSTPFAKLHRRIEPLSRSLPLLVHHKEQVIDACCTALTIQTSDEDEINEEPQKLLQAQSSLQDRKNQSVQAEKEQKRKLLKARERVDLAALTVLDLLAPLIVDLSTALLEPSSDPEIPNSFERILITLLYFINLPNPDPLALEKATQVIVHLFKTLAKDLISSDESRQLGNSRLQRIWQLARVALGAPSNDSDTPGFELEDIRKKAVDDVAADKPDMMGSDDDAISDSGAPEEMCPTKVEDLEANPNEEDEILPTTDELPDINTPISSNLKPVLVDQSRHKILKGVLNTTNPSTRRLLATSLAFLVRKKNCSTALIQMMLDDLSSVESNEITREGQLRSRKEKQELDRKGVGKKNLLGEEKGGARVFAEGITWAIAESCKTIDHRLHSRASEIFSALHSCIKQSASSEADGVQSEVSLSTGVLQGALIAVLHHSNAEHFDSVLSHMISKTKDCFNSLESGPTNTEHTDGSRTILSLQVSLQSLSVIAGVRQGSKVSESKKAETFKALYHLVDLMASGKTQLPAQLYPVVTSCCLNLMASVKSTGEFLAVPETRKLISSILRPDPVLIPLRYTYSICSALYRLDWPFLDDFLLPNLWPLVQAHLPPSDSSPEPTSLATASLMADLAGVGKKSSLPKSLLDAIVQKVDWAIKSIVGNLQGLTALPNSSDEPSNRLLNSSLREASDWLQVFVNISPDPKHRQHIQTKAPVEKWLRLFEGSIGQILESSAEDVGVMRAQYRTDYQSGNPLNQTMLVSQMIQLVRSIITLYEAPMCNGLIAGIPRLLELWGWHRNMLQEICGLCHDVKLANSKHLLPPFDSVYPHLQPALLSESSSVRFQTLTLLASLNEDTVREKIIDQCLIIEQTPLLVENARDRQMHIRKLGIMVKSNSSLHEDSKSVDVAQRYILSQLKVHFKPLWEESIKALTMINERFSTSFWKLVWSELELVLDDSLDIRWTPPAQFYGPSESSGVAGVICKFSDESQFLCTNLNLLERLRIEDLGSERIKRINEAQKLESRLDIRNYEVQLLDLLCHNSAVAQKYNKLVIDAFFKFCQPDEDDVEQGHVLGKAARTRLVNWLPLLSKFTNPKSLYRSQELRTAFYNLLADPDPSLRTLALDCVLSWKDGGIVRHQDNLRDLLDSSKFRDTLLKFSSASDGDQISDGDRAEVIPVAIRVLYGCMLMSGGRGSTAQSQAPRRSAILSALKSCSASELDLLVDLMLSPLKSLSMSKTSGTTACVKKQLGFLTMLGDVMKSMGRDLSSRWPELLDTVIGLITTAQSRIVSAAEPTTDIEGSLVGQYKKMRTQGIHRLTSFFKHASITFSFEAWIEQIFSVVIRPRLPAFASESAQAPSALLDLFHIWSTRREHLLLLVDHDPNVLTAVFKTLAVPNVKQEVINRVFDIIENILRHVDSATAYSSQRLLTSYFGVLLPNLAELLRRSSVAASYATPAGRRQINLLSGLVPFITETEHAESFCELILPLLSKRQRRVPEVVQTDLLTILSEFLGKAPKIASLPATLKTLSTFLETITGRKGRGALVKAFQAVSIHRSDLQANIIIRLVADLNCFSSKRLDEPDFEKRLDAFSEINESLHKQFGPLEWEILVYHALYQIRDEDELSLRSSSALLITRYLDILATRPQDINLRQVLTKVMMPGLKKALRSKAEIIRQDILTVISSAVEKNLPDVTELTEMKCLLVNGDKEANFFLNIYHIQSHRRTRALRRLADEAENGRLSSKVLLDIFCPLLVHTLAPKATTRIDAEVVNEAVRTIGRVVKALSWSAYNAILQFYIKLILSPETVNKTLVRVVVSILRNFHFDLSGTADQENSLTSAPAHVSEMVSSRLIPRLIRFMEQQKEGGPDESLRIMMSEGVAVVATFLPGTAKQLAIAGVVSSLSQILKSTHQETRQSARSAMANIAFLLPKECLVVVVKELRSALVRGPQVHVLAHVLFAILAKTSEWTDSELPEEVVGPMMTVLSEDLFGEPAKERQSKELKAKTKFVETRSSRSLESLQMLVSRLSSSAQLTELLRPFRGVLESTRSARALKQLDESFRRLTAGIIANGRRFDAPTVLKLVHTLIARNSDLLKDRADKNTRRVIKPTDYKLVLSDKNQVRADHYEENAHHFVSLGLDLFQALYRKGDFNLHEPSNLELIDPLVAVVGNTLYSHNSEVLGRGLRVMGILIKLPLGSVEKSASVIVRQMLSVVSHIGTSESELSQIALKTLGSVIRDCKVVELTEKQLTALLKMIAPDLEDPTRQLTLFALLRGIMAKKFLAPELYDLMDRIAHVLVTAQAAQVREVCRAIYLQFLLDYPQGKGRMTTSMEFLVKNLSYEHESGRESVLEILNAITSKIGAEVVGKHADLWFIGLVMAVANEDSPKCKEMALEVVKVLFRRVESAKATEFAERLFTWHQSKKSQGGLIRTALQLLAVYAEIRAAKDSTTLDRIHRLLLSTTKTIADQLLTVEKEDESESSLDWQIAYQTLQGLSKVYKIVPDRIAFGTKHDGWASVQDLLLFPHMWVRSSAARLVGTWFSSPCALAEPTEQLVKISRKSSLQLRSEKLDEPLALQIVKNIFFVLKTLRDRIPDGQNLQTIAASDHEFEPEGEADEMSDSDYELPKPKITCSGVELMRMVRRLSRQANLAHAKRPSIFASEDGRRWSLEPISVLRCFAALINHLSTDDLDVILQPLMIPIYRIMEDANTKDPQMVDLQSLAREVQEFLRDKVGTTKFSAVYQRLRTKAVEKRHQRKAAEALKAINHPEASAKRKASRGDAKHRNKKRKQEVFAQKKMAYGK
ncbi:hypothetical protein CROQUDRAFT_75385 [Cronartium quercuum f. sp. fusiforme G11]|uniref:ARM repeat superfamily protein n=1 Tax=Cronartium quercuum f. sp. fusiforme G11 TaxID=708437 RepID=A0A9P6NS43_9BASI|nr:hypothetical protein CROQUDRAFT_75385 [Cronartium quercuum f. sp. fusiforme G11]